YGKIGSSITLTCEVNIPQGHVIWYHDGIKLISSDSIPLKSTGLTIKNTDIGRTLTINSLKKDDFGSYTVKTKDNKRKIQIIKTIIYKSNILDTKYEYQTEILVHEPYQRQKTDVLESELPLLFIKKLEDQKVKENEQVILDCQLNRQPKSLPIWYKNDKEII